MKKELATFIAGIGLAGAVVGGVMAVDTDAPTKSAGWADPGSPVACETKDCGSPTALPTFVIVTATPTVTAVPTVFISELPDTGVGPSR